MIWSRTRSRCRVRARSLLLVCGSVRTLVRNRVLSAGALLARLLRQCVRPCAAALTALRVCVIDLSMDEWRALLFDLGLLDEQFGEREALWAFVCSRMRVIYEAEREGRFRKTASATAVRT